MGMISGAVLGVKCLGLAPGHRVLSLLSHLLRLKFQAIRFQVSLLFAVIKPARLSCATAQRTSTVCLIIAVAGIAPVFLLIINAIGEA